MGRGRRRPEEIIGEWGVRDVTPPSQKERRLLELDRDLNPLTGRPLRHRLRNFRAEADLYLASLGGPLPYMRRLRDIEGQVDAHLTRLVETFEEHRHDPEGWHRVAASWDFEDVNEQIAKHNRWFPVESRLPMDPKTRDFVTVGGRSYRRDPLDAAWILERFPASSDKR
jgi:hypothetical protein